MSPFQKSRGFSSGQMFASSQCLLKISAGLDFPSFQLNWRYPAAMASLTLWYDANVDFFDRVDVGILALSTTDLLLPNMYLFDLTGTPRYISVYLRSMIWSVAILAATTQIHRLQSQL